MVAGICGWLAPFSSGFPATVHSVLDGWALSARID